MTEEELEAHFAQFISQFEAAVTAQDGRKALDVVIKSYNEFQDRKSDVYSEKTINFIPIASGLLFGKKVEREGMSCSFCGTPIAPPVKGAPPLAVAGPSAFICRDCVGLCATVMSSDTSWRDQQIEALKSS